MVERVCPKCKSSEIELEDITPAELYGGKMDTYRCKKCGYIGTFFPEKFNNTRAHVLVHGRVQGVLFRDGTKKVAEQLNLTGFVKNLSDGRVEAVFEGSDDGVRKAVQWCHKGPFGAKVKDVDATYSKFKGEFKEFKIKY